MITDIFAHRYEGILKFDERAAGQVIGPTLVQANHIFFEDIQKRFQFKDELLSRHQPKARTRTRAGSIASPQP
jgi:hypothetical protein